MRKEIQSLQKTIQRLSVELGQVSTQHWVVLFTVATVGTVVLCRFTSICSCTVSDADVSDCSCSRPHQWLTNCFMIVIICGYEMPLAPSLCWNSLQRQVSTHGFSWSSSSSSSSSSSYITVSIRRKCIRIRWGAARMLTPPTCRQTANWRKMLLAQAGSSTWNIYHHSSMPTTKISRKKTKLRSPQQKNRQIREPF